MKKNYSEAPRYNDFIKLLSSDQRRRIVTILYKNEQFTPLKRILEQEGTEVVEYFAKWKDFEDMKKTEGTSGDPISPLCWADSEEDKDPDNRGDFFERKPVVTVNHKSPAHPHYSCLGIVDGDGKTKLCSISKTDVTNLAIFFNLPIPKQSAKRPLSTVYDVAQCLMVLEDCSLPPDVKDELIATGHRQQISTAVWARSYHFVMTKCKHIEEYIKKNLGTVDYRFDPPVDDTKNSTLNAAIVNASLPEEPKTSRKELVLFPEHRIFQNLLKVNFQGAQAVSYVEDITAAIGQLATHPDYNQIQMMLPITMKRSTVLKALQELQQAATAHKKMIIIIPQLMLFSASAWMETYKHLYESYHVLKNQLKQKEEIRHVHLLGPPVEQPFLPGSPWNLLGERLIQLTPHGMLTPMQLGALFEALKTKLQQEGIPSRFEVTRPQKLPGKAPSQHKERQERPGGYQQQGPGHGNPQQGQFNGQIQQEPLNGHLQQGKSLEHLQQGQPYGNGQQGQLYGSAREHLHQLSRTMHPPPNIGGGGSHTIHRPPSNGPGGSHTPYNAPGESSFSHLHSRPRFLHAGYPLTSQRPLVRGSGRGRGRATPNRPRNPYL